MRRYLRINRSKLKPRGTALAVAMLVVVMLSGIGVLALNTATYDLASAGAFRQGSDAESVSEGGLSIARCEMCRSIDGIVLSMQSIRETRGHSPEFVMNDATLAASLIEDETMFDAPDATDGRGSFGNMYDAALLPTPPQVEVRIDRPRESDDIAGYSLREAAGSDAASFCFRNYRVTSDGTYIPISGGANFGTKSRHRAFIVAGPLECSM